MNLKVFYDGGLNVDLDKALEGCLLKFGFHRWASGMNLETKERDLAFDDKDRPTEGPGKDDQAQALLAVAHMKIVKKTCHFCSERTVRTFIKAGNKKHPVYICEECVAFCAMIILAEQKKNATKTDRTLPETYSAKGE